MLSTSEGCAGSGCDPRDLSLGSKSKEGLPRPSPGMATGSSFVDEFSEETTCPICMEFFTDPVILGCGHNFCRACLTQFWGDPSRDPSCPQCRAPTRRFQPNRQLANIVEITKQYSLQVARWAETLCEAHQEPLKLFCRNDEAPICFLCERAREHQGHKVIPIEEATEEYKKEIQDRLQFVMKERDLVVDQLQLEEKRTQKCLAQLKEEEENVRSAFDKMQSFLMEKKVRWLSQLGELEREIERRQEQNEARYSAEISSFNNLVAEMEMKCQQPATQLLKDIRSTLNRCQKKRAKQLVPFSPEVEERLGSFCTLISVHKKALEMCEDAMGSSGEWPPISRSDPVSDSPRDGLTKVVITLDPDTSGPHLILSDDLKSVTWGQRRQNVTVNSTRFDSMPCVLGQEKFNSGRYWWEVTLEGKDKEMITQERWALGVATESVQRKGWFNLNPSEGVWAIGKSSSPPCQALAFTFPETTALILSQEPRKIQVSLDYEEGRIEFFEAGTKELIFAFCSASFSGKSVHPFFLVWTEVRLKC